MSDTIIARRYARALMEEADSLGIVDDVDADVALIRNSLAGSAELRSFFSSPVISREKKTAVVKSLFEGKISDSTLRFLLLMVGKKREQIFSRVGEAYADLRDDQLGIVNVSVRVARPMIEDEEKTLQRSIEELIGKRVRLQTSLDAALVGGLVVRIGDTLYDGSISNQLQSLRKRLESGRMATNNT